MASRKHLAQTQHANSLDRGVPEAPGLAMRAVRLPLLKGCSFALLLPSLAAPLECMIIGEFTNAVHLRKFLCAVTGLRTCILLLCPF